MFRYTLFRNSLLFAYTVNASSGMT
jgi:hypothetical protein